MSFVKLDVTTVMSISQSRPFQIKLTLKVSEEKLPV